MYGARERTGEVPTGRTLLAINTHTHILLKVLQLQHRERQTLKGVAYSNRIWMVFYSTTITNSFNMFPCCWCGEWRDFVEWEWGYVTDRCRGLVGLGDSRTDRICKDCEGGL